MNKSNIFFNVFIFIGIWFFLINIGYSYTDLGTILECTNCTDCTSALTDANAGDEVRLIENINNHAGSCINFNHTSNVVFNCQDNLIDGQDSGYGIYESTISGIETTDITIKNCKINDFGTGIYTKYVDDSLIKNVNTSSITGTGVYISYGDNNDIEDISVASNGNIGVYSYYSNNNIFKNIISSDTGYTGFYAGHSNYNKIYNIITNNNHYYGIDVAYGDNNLFSNITANSNGRVGIRAISGNNNFSNGLIAHNTNNGIEITSSVENNVFTKLKIINNTLNGITVGANSQNNFFYDNYFENTNNIYFVEGACSLFQKFNTTMQVKTNMIGGNNIGGNYWSSPTKTGYSDVCSDSNSDNICDLPFKMFCDQMDNLPITNNTNSKYTLTSCATLAGPGIYTLENDISNYPSTCFNIRGNDITIDCQGHTIDGQDSGYGIYALGIVHYKYSNITLKNCKINDFSSGIYTKYINNILIKNVNTSSINGYGIFMTYGDNNTIEDISVASNGNIGVYSSYSNNNLFKNIISSDTGYTGFYASHSNYNKIYNITTNNNHYYGIDVSYSENNLFSNITANSNGRVGIRTFSGNNNFSGGLLAYNNNDGIEITNSVENCVFTKLLIINNTNNGITMAASTTKNNYFYNNYLSNTNNLNMPIDAINFFNITLSCGGDLNIVNGDCMGGNYWTHPISDGYSNTCIDSDNNNICDNKFEDIVTGGANFTDYYPLINTTAPLALPPALPPTTSNSNIVSQNVFPYESLFQISLSLMLLIGYFLIG